MEPDEPGRGSNLYGLTVVLDRDRFLRRTCPSCGLDFKSQATDADIGSPLDAHVRRKGRDIGTSSDPPHEDEKARLRCPYCGHKAEAGEMLSDDSRRYIREVAIRSIAQPLIDQALAQIAATFNGGPRRGGFITMSMKHEHVAPPPRPISGPDAPDMLVVHLLCCGRRVKVMEGLRDLGACPYCFTQVAIT